MIYFSASKSNFMFFLYQFCHENNFLEIIQQIKQFGSILNEGTGSDYSHKGIIYNIFSYLFFPFEFINNHLNFIFFAILESLFLIYILVLVSKNDLKKTNINNSTCIFLLFVIFFYLIIYLSIFPNVYSNFGLVIRQKLMIIPFIFFFILSLKNFSLLRYKKSKKFVN